MRRFPREKPVPARFGSGQTHKCRVARSLRGKEGEQCSRRCADRSEQTHISESTFISRRTQTAPDADKMLSVAASTAHLRRAPFDMPPRRAENPRPVPLQEVEWVAKLRVLMLQMINSC